MSVDISEVQKAVLMHDDKHISMYIPHAQTESADDKYRLALNLAF